MLLNFFLRMSNWSMVEYEVVGENGFRSNVRCETPTQMGCEVGEKTYSSILLSIRGNIFISN